DMTIVYAADGTSFPPRGVLGGGDGKESETIKLRASEKIVLPAFSEETIEDGARIEFTACGGGGYGDPLKRDPKRVAATVNRGWLSREDAENVYCVALKDAEDAGLLMVDEVRTAELRSTRQ
ncbi:hydantoinase B/oxoprolinase family protein, partial [Mesorhizobium sp. M2A.F.Ca.ET.037.01.1.1]